MKLPLLPESYKLFSFLLLAFTISAGCNHPTEMVTVNPAFSKYIERYTSGTVSKKNTIRVQLAIDAPVTHSLNETLADPLFQFTPAVKGKAYWIDARTVEFKPDQDLTPGQLYLVSFKLSKILKVPNDYADFKFNLQVLKPAFLVEEYGLTADDGEKMTLKGMFSTADVEEAAKVEKMLSATIGNEKASITWMHDETSKYHGFVINNIQRKTSARILTLAWNGQALGSENKGSKAIEIPALGDFKVLNIRPAIDNQPYAVVQFSDLLATSQMLEGLIGMSEQENLSFTISGSEVKLFGGKELEGNYTVNVHEGIENISGKKLENPFVANLFFENRLPSVKIKGRGTLLPNSTGKLTLPFEAINLKAIDISIVKIFESNIPQFLQQNALDGYNQLREVARPVVQSTLRLDNDITLNLHKRNNFLINLDEYVRAEPGAIYRVTLAFAPEYSIYACENAVTANKDEEYDYYWASQPQADDQGTFWRRYEDYYPFGYNWELRDDPCSPSYYNRERFASINILASNIGLTAKQGNNNSLFVSVNDIISTAPMNNIDLEVYNYQQQIIGKGRSTGDGTAIIELKSKPFLLIAKKGNERGYLKLEEAVSLPLGRFEVEGEEVKEGLKGFIFGERGVWRPGDSLFLSCVIDDKENRLPHDHPIEMDLISPRGQVYRKLIQVNASDGFNVFKTTTDPDAPTGNWICRVKIGGATFEKKLKIETVMPNRLKIDVNFNGLQAFSKNQPVNGLLTAQWLFGAPAKNLKARVDAQLYKKKTAFPSFEGYIFDNPTTSYTSQSVNLFDGTTDEQGKAVIHPKFSSGAQAPGQLLANIMVRVFEPGGNFSIENFAMPYNPYSSYVGIKIPEPKSQWGWLQAGQSHPFSIVNVNDEGKLVQSNTMTQIELYKIQWSWWWDKSGDDLTNFSQNEYNKLIRKDTLQLKSGKGIYSINIPEENWGRYLILVKDMNSGHTTGGTFYIDDMSWQKRSDNEKFSAAALLSFSSDKQKYAVGDNVQLTIPSSKGGKALISIESGTKVVKTFWVNTDSAFTKFSFKAESSMLPNVYVNISMLQPHAQTINDRPIRMYGVIPIMIEDKNSVLKPVIQMPDVIEPETNSYISVKEAGNKNMTYVIALVDEGLLDLTHFKTPDPHEAFFAKEALGVKSWDVYDDVIGAWGTEFARMLTIGGDEEATMAARTRKANRFKPVVKFLGPFQLKGGTATHAFKLPQYMGSIRAMVVAAGDNGYGKAEKTVTVKKPLMVQATMPRVLGPLEEINIPVNVFTTEAGIKNVNIRLEANNRIDASGTENLSFTQPGEKMVYFKAKAKELTGIGKIKIIATSGKNTDVAEIELDIRNANQPVTEVIPAVLNPGQSILKTIAMIGSPDQAKAIVEISSIPAIDLEKRLSYLIDYPHGCVEQITSTAFPQLFLNQLIYLNEQSKKNIDGNIRSAIRRIANFQTVDGGFSYWPGGNIADEWGTSYAGHFLLSAASQGYNVSSALLQQWRQYERQKSLNWNVTDQPQIGSDLSQAYRLYLLALAKAPELGAMNRLKEYKFLSAQAKWRLAAAYQLAGQSQTALNLISGLPVTFGNTKYPGITYGSELRDEAMVLETLTLLNRKREAQMLVQSVAAKLSQQQWYSTQTAAYSLIAIAKYSGQNAGGEKIKVNGQIQAKKLEINSPLPVSQTSVDFQNGKAEIRITNLGNNVLYVRLINSGLPAAVEPAPIVNHPDILQVKVEYLSATGQPLDITKLKQGTDFISKVTIKNPGRRGNYERLVLSQIFPGGWEILNTRLFNSEGAFKSSPFDYMDIRDDRVNYYFGLKENQTATYYVQLNAAYSGRYFWPGVYCEAMYDHTVNGGLLGKWVEVTE